MRASSIRASAMRRRAERGAKAVLEVRSHKVPFILEDGQIVGRLIYERHDRGARGPLRRALKSNYQGQGLKLSKHFK